MADKIVEYRLRVRETLHDSIKEAAAAAGRSMQKELTAALDEKYLASPDIDSDARLARMEHLLNHETQISELKRHIVGLERHIIKLERLTTELKQSIDSQSRDTE